MTSKAFQKLQALQSELNQIVVERETQVEGSLAALLAGVHVLFLGPPGTAKSLLTNILCKALDDAHYFQWLLTKFSTPEELFGAFSIKGLQNDEYRRITQGKAAESHILFLDEIFKANSAILNALLTLINERVFHNNGQAVKTPLLTCFAASNELPQGEELGALYDRFVLKYWVRYIDDDQNFFNLLNGSIGNSEPKTTLTLAEISSLQKEADQVTVSQDIFDAVREINSELRAKGIVVSDRKWKTSIKVLRAVAFIRGQSEVTSDELEIYADMLWQNPDDRKVVLDVVSPRSNPLNAKAVEYLDQALELYNLWRKATDDDMQSAQTNASLKDMIKQIDELAKDRPAAKAKKLMATRDRVKKMQQEIISKMLGK
jgi:MoxR-like ATPase